MQIIKQHTPTLKPARAGSQRDVPGTAKVLPDLSQTMRFGCFIQVLCSVAVSHLVQLVQSSSVQANERSRVDRGILQASQQRYCSGVHLSNLPAQCKRLRSADTAVGCIKAQESEL